MKKNYIYAIGLGVSLIASAGAVIYSYVSGKKFKEAIDVLDEYSEQIEDSVEGAVNEAYEETKNDVKTELNRQILNLDISEIKEEIIKEAAEKVRVRLEDFAVDAMGEIVEKEMGI